MVESDFIIYMKPETAPIRKDGSLRNDIFEVFYYPMFQRRILEGLSLDPLDHSFVVWGLNGIRYKAIEYSDLESNFRESLGIRKDILSNSVRPIIAVVVLRELSQKEILLPKGQDLEELIKSASRGTTLVECGKRDGQPNLEFLFLKPGDGHGLSLSLSDEMARLIRSLPKRRNQREAITDMASHHLMATYYTIPTENFTRDGVKLRKDFRFA